MARDIPFSAIYFPIYVEVQEFYKEGIVFVCIFYLILYSIFFMKLSVKTLYRQTSLLSLRDVLLERWQRFSPSLLMLLKPICNFSQSVSKQFH